MRVSMKVDYGVRALVNLAENLGQGLVQASEIAERQRIPEPYLDQLLTTMHRAGFIESRRGPQGGHLLAKHPSEINLGMVVTTLEGSAAPLVCIEEPRECGLSSNCGQRDVWHTAEEALQKILGRSSIASLTRRKDPPAGRDMYYI